MANWQKNLFPAFTAGSVFPVESLAFGSPLGCLPFIKKAISYSIKSFSVMLKCFGWVVLFEMCSHKAKVNAKQIRSKNKMSIHIGIDPGVSGGIAVLGRNGYAQAYKMPPTNKDLWELIQEIKAAADFEQYPVKAFLESVSSSPQMGVVSAFTFGQGFGNLEMSLTAAGIPFERVSPQKWQKAMGCMTKGDKNVTKRRAQELFPQIKITHAIADALLIAAYGAKHQ